MKGNLKIDGSFKALKFTAWVWLLVCISFPGCGKQDGSQVGQTKYQIEKKYDNDTIDFTLKIEKSTLAISDTFHVQLQVVAGEDVRVTLPSLAQELGEYEFNILDSQSTGPKLLENNRVLRRSTYLLEPILAGTRTLPALEIIYKTDQKSESLVTDPIAIEVTSPFDNGGVDDNQTPADIKPLVAVKFKHQYQWLWITITVLVLCVLALIIFIRYRRKHQRAERRYKSAHQLAFDRLDELESRKLLTQGLFKPFYEEISSILRWYIEDRFRLKAPERTTEEFLREAYAANTLNDQHTEKLKKVLVHCDQVKFARYTPEMDEVNHSVALVKDFIESTVDENCQIDITDTEGVAPSVLQASRV